MGKTGAKFLIGIGFALIFLSLLVKTWKVGNVCSADAQVDLQNASTTELKTEPVPPPKPGKVALDSENLAGKLGVKKEDLEANCKKELDDAKAKVDKEAKSWNDQVDNGQKANWDPAKKYVKDMGEWYSNQAVKLAKDAQECNKEQKDAALAKTWADARRQDYRWLISIIMFLGTLMVAAGFVCLTITGEGNEKGFALLGLAGVLYFISQYWGNIAF
jgi:Na+-transporting methylmalonyl-CoA/oxaloacetate decarboxylase gamma subunit